MSEETSLQSKIESLEKRLSTLSDLRTSTKFFLDNSPDAVFLVDSLSRKIVDLNAKVEDIAGLASPELLGRNLEQFVRNEDIELLHLAYDQALTQEESLSVELQIIRSPGNVAYVELSAKLVKDLTRDLSYFLVTAKNMKRYKQRHEMYETIINAFPIMLWHKDLNNRYYKVNKAAADFEGVSPSDIIGKTPFDLYPSDLAEEYYQDDLEVINSKMPRTGIIEKHIVIGTKQLRWTYTCKAPITNNEGDVTGLIIFANDITEQRTAQERLKQSEIRFKRITETVTDYIYTVWVENNVAVKTYHGPACVSVMGYTSEEFDEDQNLWLNMVVQDDKYIVLEKTLEILQGKEPGPIVHRIRKKDGSIRWVTNTPVLHFNEQGKLFSYDGLIRDVTDIKTKELEIKESEARLSSIFKVAPVGIGIMVDRTINDVNECICEMTGYTKDELVGNSVHIIYPTIEEYEFVLREQAWVISNNGSLSIETIWKKKNGDCIDILYSSTPIMSGDINQGIMFTAQDITKRKKDEESLRKSELELRQQNEKIRDINVELRQAKDKAEESDKLKSAFLANMSHEIRTPMNAILGFSDFLRDPNIEREEFEEFLDIINSSGEQLMNIINDIIDISKIEAGQEKVIEKPVNINTLLSEIHSMFKTQTGKKGIELVFEKHDENEENLTIITDHTKLKQIIINLVSNAIKFTNKGYVKFGFEIKGDILLFQVADTGIGISPEHHKTIFERFRQAELSLAKKLGGTGLGLSISKALVELLGGTIWLESETDKGSTFFFTLPYVVGPTAAEAAEKAAHTGNFDWSSVQIIVAEDDDINYYYLQKALEATKMKLLRAKNGVECINLFKENPFIRLVLMDIKMPEMDGYQATQLIKAINPNVIVIAQTAFALANEKEKARKAGLDDYISKPIDRDKLLLLIEKYLSKNA